MLKKLLAFLFCITVSFQLHADIPEQLQEYVLENGLTVFLLEDCSTATVNIEFLVRAGFSSQTQNDIGFFTLYSNILKASSPKLSFTDVQTNSDSTRYLITTTNQNLYKELKKLSETAFSLNYSDEILTAELEALKKEVTQNSQELSTIINSAIDSKVFSQSPWKHDSGIYPALFNRTTQNTARTILKNIQDKWYTPHNSALFIYGNINNLQLLPFIKQHFGTSYSAYSLPQEKPLKPVNNHRKFVIHDKELSPDFTQVVIQYSVLDREQADIMAFALNNNASSFKNNACDNQELNILGNDYIDVSSASKKDSSRLIFQTLLQPPKNKKIKTNSCKQAEIFLDLVKNLPQNLSQNEFTMSQSSLSHQMNYIFSNSKGFMENLSNYWGTLPYHSEATKEQNEQIFTNSITANSMLERRTLLQSIKYDSTIAALTSEEPFVFVIINSSDYKKNKNEYKKLGYEEITSQNASWYTQKLYKEIKDTYKPSEQPLQTAPKSQDNDYYAKNISQITTGNLSNGIQFVTKQNSLDKATCIMLSVSGGRLKSYNNNGFEEVMLNIIAQNIQKEINTKLSQGYIIGPAKVSAQSNLYTSKISIECSGGAEDLPYVLKAISDSLIFSDIMPAIADRIVAQRQYKKRLENGSSTNQLYSKFINTVFPDSPLCSIYETKNDILQNTNYQLILQNYPEYLNADLYSVIITGSFYDNIYDLLNDSLGSLSSYKSQKNIDTEPFYDFTPINLDNLKNKKVYTKINHTFLTDIPKEKAGPMPKTLIPTKDFLDPVIYVINAPQSQNLTETAVFYALIQQFQNQMQEVIKDNPKLSEAKVNIRLPAYNIPYALVIVQNVARTKECDAAYKLAVKKLCDSLKQPLAEKTVIPQIQSFWILQQLAGTDSVMGTAELLQSGLEIQPDSFKPSMYLDFYNAIQTATLDDYIQASNKIPSSPHLAIYSSDSRQ